MLHVNAVAEKPELPPAYLKVVDMGSCDIHKILWIKKTGTGLLLLFIEIMSSNKI